MEEMETSNTYSRYSTIMYGKNSYVQQREVQSRTIKYRFGQANTLKVPSEVLQSTVKDRKIPYSTENLCVHCLQNQYNSYIKYIKRLLIGWLQCCCQYDPEVCLYTRVSMRAPGLLSRLYE